VNSQAVSDHVLAQFCLVLPGFAWFCLALPGSTTVVTPAKLFTVRFWPRNRTSPHKPVPIPTPSRNSASNGALGEGFSKAFEFAATPGVFAAIGYGLDRVFGTKPFLMIGLTVFAVIGMFVIMWIDYDASMKVHETSAIAAKRAADGRHRASVRSDFGVENSEENSEDNSEEDELLEVAS
jgi:F0F1-type ATP synthase assembly protein I